ncbi:unnamed protein product [Toxocara canis]|uniref:Transcription initiation factor TFIID subunit 12 n=1 Tax=Toxocara canis TaxID=6265 RepID=A0A183UUE7_TOXCA|nr:unnamed protein product [Toxocara canis]
MPTRKLISTIDQQGTYYRIDPAQPNTAIPVSTEAVRNEPHLEMYKDLGVLRLEQLLRKTGTRALMTLVTAHVLKYESKLSNPVVVACLNRPQIVLDRSCKLCRHRGSSTLEAKDVSFVLEHYYKMPKVVRGSGMATTVKTEVDVHNVDSGVSQRADFTAHNQRLALIEKTLKKS